MKVRRGTVWVPKWARYCAHIQSLVGPTRLWPWGIRESFMQGHMTNPQRFTVVWFLRTNGCPELWVLNRFTDFEAYDHEAIRQVNWLLKEFNKRPNRYKTWDVVLGRST
jgi:hypothetical protein